MTRWPDARARAATRLVFPTPGLPSKRRARRGSCNARNRRQRLEAGVVALKLKVSDIRVLSRRDGDTSGPMSKGEVIREEKRQVNTEDAEKCCDI